MQSGGGRDAFWRELRAQVMARDPICKRCHAKPSKHADHKLAKRDGGRDELANLEGLCHSCHSSKTAREDGGFGNPRRRGEQGTRRDGRGVVNPPDRPVSSARPPLHTHPQVLHKRFSAAAPPRLAGPDHG